MPKRNLTVTSGPSLVILNSKWMRPWLNGVDRNTATFSGFYPDTGEDGSVTVAVDGLFHLYDKNGSEIRIEGVLTALDGVEVDDRELSFYYHTKTHVAHILI